MTDKSEPQIHHLKTWPEYYQATINGTKLFEIRKNDRNFKPGDFVALHEFCPEKQELTYRVAFFEIGFLLQGVWGLAKEHCVFTLLRSFAAEKKAVELYIDALNNLPEMQVDDEIYDRIKKRISELPSE